MNLKELVGKLQTKIDSEMNEFTNLGQKAKKHQEEIDKIYIKMAKILKELQPVETIIRIQNPDKCKLFDELLKLL